MKHTLFTLLLILSCGLISYPQSAEAISDTIYSAEIDDDPDWRNDSLIKALYAPVTACKLSDEEVSKLRKSAPMRISGGLITNPDIPTTVVIDKSRAVGQIPIMSGTTPHGAKTYSVPLDLYPGVHDLTPELTLSYNSQNTNSLLGFGWNISGLPQIVRSTKNIYFDGVTDGVHMDYNDAFILDGIRLIKLSSDANAVYYQSEHGNIKAKGHIQSKDITYFEVFYPEGNKAILGNANGDSYEIYYPITSLSDLYGNTVTYEYYQDGLPKISKILYNGSSVEFNYESRQDSIIKYIGGKKLRAGERLASIECKLGTQSLCKYKLSYKKDATQSLLSQIDYSVNGNSFNPLKFYYGTGSSNLGYESDYTQLIEWYKTEDPRMTKVVKGKFDYYNSGDGLIVLPNKNPYWRRYIPATSTTHSKKRYYNLYEADEKILIYAGLQGKYASPMPNLVTGEGFIDIFCADLDGQQEEYIVKVNDNEVNGKDRVTFNVLQANDLTGLSLLYTREFDFPTIYTDKRGKKSIQPKFYHVGDFNGDGKMEVLAISEHQPFDDTNLPSKCYVFDLAGGKLMYSGTLCKFVIQLIGEEEPDRKKATNNSDKFLVLDYDGDGKSDICHINETGTDIYTFDVNGSVMVPRKVATYSGLKRADLENRDLLLGECNGDGLPDLFVSSEEDKGNGTWKLFNSKGDGTFVSFDAPGGPLKSSNDNEDIKEKDYTGFLLQDVNGDGITDLINHYNDRFHTRISGINSLRSEFCQMIYADTDSNTVLVPANIYSRNRSTKLLGLKEGRVIKYSFNRDDYTGVMLTGMVNSLGIIEHNEYARIDYSGFYTPGRNAKYPYVNIQEPLTVIATTTTYVDGVSFDLNRFGYSNAVIHRQGLGFRGFESIVRYDSRGRAFTTIYDPYNYGIIKSETSPMSEKTYTHEVNVGANKILSINLSKLEETDLLKNSWATTTYTYDKYGFPTKEERVFSDDIVKTTTSYYEHSDNIASNNYSLGFLREKKEVTDNGSSSCSRRVYRPASSKRQPYVKIEYINDKSVSQSIFSYDSNGNVTSLTEKKYSSPNSLKTVYEYDSHGRLTKMTDSKGLTEEYSYDVNGRLSTQTDHYGGVTTFSYDAFGRENKIRGPDGTVKTVSYNWITSSDRGHLYSIVKEQTGMSTETAVYDALNREVRQSRLIPENDNCLSGIAHIDFEYDNFGNLTRKSFPYSDGTSGRIGINYSYDEYDRLVKVEENLDGFDSQVSNFESNKMEYSYSGSSITVAKNKITTTYEYDSQDNLISASDPGGVITYNLGADGLPSSIMVGGEAEISITYDDYRRRISLNDPSHGMTTYEYDSSGNLSKTVDAKGNETLHTYDKFNRLIKTTTPEFSTDYTYNSLDELTSITSDNGASSAFTYDSYGRLSSERETAGGKWLQKDYSYSDGNINAIKYTSHLGVLTTEHRRFERGCLSSVKLDDSTEIYRLRRMDPNGKVARYMSGGLDYQFTYKVNGILQSHVVHYPRGTNKWGSLNSATYLYDPATRNPIFRVPAWGNDYEMFEYDGLNRLVSARNDSVIYSSTGNLLNRRTVGTLEYDHSANPYAVTSLEPADGMEAPATVDITYASFMRPVSIESGGKRLTFTYNSRYDRVKSEYSVNGKKSRARYYLGGCYECDSVGGWVEKLYLNGGYYGSTCMFVNIRGTGIAPAPWYLCRDNLGSLTGLISKDYEISERWSYDPWGGFRDPSTLEPIAFPEYNIIDRGFCGHEYLPEFGLINMNARLYDPMLGRFLSPDPYVQFPDATQSFNRYTYAMNNPLLYVDENGEVVHILIGAAIGGIGNLIYKACTGQIHNFGDGLAAFGIGAVAGGVGAATGGVAFAAAGGAALGAGGFVAGAWSGAIGSALSMPVLSAGNNVYFGDPFLSPEELAWGIVGGAVTGGVVNGSIAMYNGRSFWKGEIPSLKIEAPLPEITPVPEQAPKAEAATSQVPKTTSTPNKNYTGYMGYERVVGPNGEITYELRYVGITSRNPEIRFYEHSISNTPRATLEYRCIIKFDSLIEARIWEQQMINQYGMMKNGGILYNLRNEIAPKYWNLYGIK